MRKVNDQNELVELCDFCGMDLTYCESGYYAAHTEIDFKNHEVKTGTTKRVALCPDCMKKLIAVATKLMEDEKR